MAEYTLPPLPYDHGALEPHIDAKTMEIHHGKHHAAYVNNLNAGLKDHPDHQGKTIEALISNLNALPEGIRTAVRNNGGGHANHSLFWQIMKPGGGGEPTGAVAQAITARARRVRRVQGSVRQGGGDAVRLRLGLAGRGQGRQARRDLDPQPGQPDHGRSDPDSRARRLGARLLPEVPEPPARLHRRLVEHGELGRGQPPLRGRQGLIQAIWPRRERGCSPHFSPVMRTPG